ncbi:MAG: TM0106 family RecB-like putative nuclease, partial [Actinobacteria bacterium]|nr:TM0106 family RecB-like putative nuclease [Actinomycetota bacterium]
SRRARLHEILLARVRAVGADGRRESAAPVSWADPQVAFCGRCEVCAPEVERTRDPLLIAGIRTVQRNALVEAGYETIDAVAGLQQIVHGEVIDPFAPEEPGGCIISPASSSSAVEGISSQSLARLVEQAELQLIATPGAPPPVRVVDPTALAIIPPPDPGDLFFDFEGDPLYREPGGEASARWGIDYLFGMVDTSEVFTSLWAHDLEAEREALLRFLALVEERRRVHPGMRIYHYAAYERTHLLSIAARHGVGEAEVDRLLREHVLVDLYPIARRALRVGSRSYSIKKLEPLYMGDELRDEEGVTNAAQSVTEYAEASAQLASADPEEREVGQRRMDAIAEYNRYDCVSTLRLRDWLLSIATRQGVESVAHVGAEARTRQPRALEAGAGEVAGE